MKTLLLTFFLVVTFTAGAQPPPFNFKFAPFALVDEGTFPTITAGVEFSIAKQMTIYTELGICYRKGYYDNSDTPFVSSTGYKAKIELRYYLNPGTDELDRTYVGANIFFTNSRHNDELPYYYMRDTSLFRGDAFSSKKIALGLNVLAGRQYDLSRRILMDMYAGVGIRFRHAAVDHLESDPVRDSLAIGRHLNLDDIRAKVNSGNGHLVAFNLTLGIRFCWKQRRRD